MSSKVRNMEGRFGVGYKKHHHANSTTLLHAFFIIIIIIITLDRMGKGLLGSGEGQIPDPQCRLFLQQNNYDTNRKRGKTKGHGED